MKQEYLLVIFSPDDSDYTEDIKAELDDGLMLPSGSYLNVARLK